VPFLYDDLYSDRKNADLSDENYEGSFHIVYLVSEGMAAVRLDGKWGFIEIPSAQPKVPAPTEAYVPPVNSPSPTPDNQVYEVADILQKGATRVQFGEYIWRVLAVEDGKALIITETIIENRPFNVEWKTITWEKCDIRKYLNGEFYDRFSADEKKMISETKNENPDNPLYGTAAGRSTTDNVFLLSLEDVVKYFGDSGQLENISDVGQMIDDEYNGVRATVDGDGKKCYWWLRTFGYSSAEVVVIDYDGVIQVDGDVFAKDTGGVRPALWLKLE
jgi:hypothetical protein